MELGKFMMVTALSCFSTMAWVQYSLGEMEHKSVENLAVETQNISGYFQ